jgi:PAS domain S-box-containing protein
MTNAFFILDLISAIFNFSLGYFILYKDFKRTANRVFFLLTLAATFWAASSAAFRALGIPTGQPLLEMALEENPVAWAFNQVGWIGIAFLPSILLHLSIIITSPKRIFKEKKLLVSIYLASLIFLLWTFFEKPITYLIFYTLFTLFFIFCFSFSLTLLLKNYFSIGSSQEKTRLRYFLVGVFIPIIGTVLGIIYSFLKYKQFITTTFSFYLFSSGHLFVAIGVLKYTLPIDYRGVLERIFKSLTEMVIVTDQQGIILMTNEKTLNKLEYKKEEFIGERIENFIESGKQRFEEILKKLKNYGDVFEGRINLLTRGKETVPFLSSFSFTKEGIIFVGQDIKELLTYQEKLEKEVKEKTRELEEAKTVLEIKVKARTKELKELTQSLEEQVKERTDELQERIQELERFQKFVVGREAKMLELKNEVERLKKELKKNGNRSPT